MAFGSNRSANFVIAAKDAATGPIGNVGKAMGKLKRGAGTAFKVIAGAALAAASAIAAFTTAAVMGAIADEKATARLNATLRTRGLLTEKNTKAIDEAIAAGQRLAFTDDDVRTSIETATQFTGKFSQALKIQRVAQDLAVAKGIDLATATQIVGKAFIGNGKALKAYGIELNKTSTVTSKVQKITRNGAFMVDQTKTTTKAIKGQAALNLITEQFGGIANEVAGTTAVKLEAAFIRFNESIETFGAKFLPLVNEGLAFLTEKALPAFEGLLDTVGPIVSDLVDDYVRPLVDSVGELFAEFDRADFSPLELALTPIKLALDGIKFVIDLIVAGLRLMNDIGDFGKNLPKAQGGAGYTTSYGPSAPMSGGGGGYSTSYGSISSAQFTIGKKAQSEFSYVVGENLANQTRATSAARTFPRGGK